jgi:acyl-coenzyme A synthetase/AMP-(fatty) acid ligase
MLTRKGQDLLAVAALMAMLAVASTLAMMRIGVSQQPVDPTLNPSPLGVHV